MKCIILVAILAIACATPIERPKEEKKEAKPEEERKGLQWPLPDFRNEGDLMLLGSHYFDRVEELRKAKVENDVDKMILSFGRNYLRKAQKYLEATPDFKIPVALCKDSRDLNSTRRWEIRIQPEHQPVGDNKEQPEQANKEKQPAQAEQQQKPQNDAPAQDTKTPQNDVKPVADKKDEKLPASNATEAVNATEAPISVPKPEHDSFEAQRGDWYRRMGENFARLLMKRYRKETLIAEENEYLDSWLEDDSIHYAVMGIYCHEGENVKEILKKIATYVEEK